MLMTEKLIRLITAHQLLTRDARLKPGRKSIYTTTSTDTSTTNHFFHLKLNNKSLYLQHHYVFNI